MPLSRGVCYRDFFHLPQTVPKVALTLPDLGNQIEEEAARIERELQLLRADPSACISRDVYQRWTEHDTDLGVHQRTHVTPHDGVIRTAPRHAHVHTPGAPPRASLAPLRI